MYGVGPVTAARWVRELRLKSVDEAVEFYLTRPPDAPSSSQSSVASTSSGTSPAVKKPRLDPSSDFLSDASDDEDVVATGTRASSQSSASAAAGGAAIGRPGGVRRALGMSANLRYGLAFHAELSRPVLRARALALVRWFRVLVRRALGEPGARVVVAGGFRRGKPQGHDIDILVTHPTPGTASAL